MWNRANLGVGLLLGELAQARGQGFNYDGLEIVDSKPTEEEGREPKTAVTAAEDQRSRRR